jgi:hypothetical protein
MDLQLFKIVDVLDGTYVSDTTADGVRTIRIRIRGFAQSVSEVTINGYLAAAFSVVGTRLLDIVIPTVPRYLYQADITDIDILVLSSDFSGSAREAEILFSIGRQSSKISGGAYIIQKWLRFFLMSPGTDRKDPSAGVGILRLAGQITENGLRTAQAMIARKHEECLRQIRDRQLHATGKSVRRDEILQSATLREVSLDEQGRLRIRSILVDGRGQVLSPSMRI